MQSLTEQDPDPQSVNRECFHCSLPIADDLLETAEIDDKTQLFCCPGCKAVALTINNAGLGDYYHFRTEEANKADADLESLKSRYAVYDHPAIQQGFVSQGDLHRREAALAIDGIRCAACAWLNQKHVEQLPGVDSVDVNYATHRATVRWDDSQVHLSRILSAIAEIGYRPHPYNPARQQQALQNERKQLLRRLGVTAALGMQIMILALALYGGDWFGIEPEFRDFFRRANLLLTAPILFYAAKPFYAGAWSDIRFRRLGMDVPVALGLSLAFVASLWATLSGSGHVYFDSIAMFTFFVLGARYLELGARLRASAIADRAVPVIPEFAVKLDEATHTETIVPAIELTPGQHILIRPGETVPADGIVTDGRSTVDESILTGESLPVSKSIEDKVFAGAINIESPLTLEVTRAGANTTLRGIENLMQRAQSERPAAQRLADRIAGWFIGAVLIIAVVVAVSWWLVDSGSSSRWLETTIAVLIVTCPCALSLATPSALAMATGNLLKNGLLVTRGDALETLARATHFVFDKTGTLTMGEPELENIVTHDSNRNHSLAVAAALERYSEHPLGKAIVKAAAGLQNLAIRNVENIPGAGIKGEIEGEIYYAGSVEYIKRLNICIPDHVVELAQGQTPLVVLANERLIIAAFNFRDRLRPGATELIQSLRSKGRKIILLSGDRNSVVQQIAEKLSINMTKGGQTPEAKLDFVKSLQQQNVTVAMIGDGINDAPVIGGADVSIAVATTANLAAANADLLLVNPDLHGLQAGIETAIATRKVIRQNLLWAAGYNILAIPAAALGYVPPWLAAIGMSLSSLIVVLNASRLLQRKSTASD